MKNKEVLTRAGNFFQNQTLRNFETAIAVLQKYEDENEAVHCSDVSFQFFENFQLFLTHQNYTKNTIGSVIGIIKNFTRRLYKKDLTSFDGSGVFAPKEVTTTVYTSIDELRVLYHLDLSKTPGKERVRDVYVCQCFLGLRVSDMFSFMKNFMKMAKKEGGRWYFEIKTKKTGEVVVIPAPKVVQNIAKKRGYCFGEPFSEWYYSSTLKNIYRKAGLDKKILFHRTEGGAKIERTVNKSDLLGTHCARRSFATNAYLAGVDTLSIMKITGHKSHSSFMRYIRCSNLESALRLAEHHFFNQELQ